MYAVPPIVTGTPVIFFRLLNKGTHLQAERYSIEDNSKMIQLPKYIQIDINEIKTVREAYYRKHQSYPTDDEVATSFM
jgi:hypothetical protein